MVNPPYENSWAEFSKGVVSGEKIVSGDGILNVGMSSSSKVPTCWSGFCGLKGPEGFCEGSGDLVSQFRGRLTVFKTKFGTFLNDCDTCSKFSQFVRYSSVVMPLLCQMSMDDSSGWLLDSGASATVLAERFATSYGVPIQVDTKVISSRQLMVLQSRCQAKLRLEWELSWLMNGGLKGRTEMRSWRPWLGTSNIILSLLRPCVKLVGNFGKVTRGLNSETRQRVRSLQR